jgi:hemoglobin/transferrin/lactoferrin receptor protein
MRLVLSVMILFFVVHATAQSDSTESKQLGEVFVTAQRTKQAELKIPYAVKRLGQEQLQHYVPRTTPEALQGINGVFVQKTNHGGGSAFVRGLTGNQTLMLIDGIRLNNSTYRYGPNQYLNTIDPFLIEHIEVAKGTGSVQYGSDAMGGVIQLFSKEPAFAETKPVFSGGAQLKYMSVDMEKTGRAHLSYADKRFAISAGLTLRDFGDLVGGDTTGKQSPSGYKEYAWFAKAKMQLSNHVTLILSHQQLRQDHVPVYHKVKLENFFINEFDLQQHQLQYARLEIKTANSWANKLSFIASNQQTNEGRTSWKNGSSTLRNEKDRVNTKGLTTDIASSFTNIWTANSGVEFYFDKVRSKTIDSNLQTNIAVEKRGLYPDESQYGNYSIYTLHHINYKRLSVDAGLRYNGFSIRLEDTSLGKVKVNPSAFVYNAAVSYGIAHNHFIYSHYSTGYRAPNVDDMGTLGIVDFRYELPTADLKPEQSKTFEIGYKFQTRKLKADVAFYHMQLTNLITRVKVDGEFINGYQVYRKENTEKAYIKGVEAELIWEPVKKFVLQANGAYAYGQNKSKNEPLRRVPPFNGRLSATYQWKGWFGSAEILYASDQDRLAQGDKDDNRIPKGGTPGWEVINVYAGYKWKDVQLNACLQNLLNEDYRTHGSGINAVGRSIWLSLRYEFHVSKVH